MWIGTKRISDYGRTYIIGEIGINHNGDLSIAKQLIDVAHDAGCDAVKFQKRTIELTYTSEELAEARVSPFGETNGDLKRGLEFGEKEYYEIFEYCQEKQIDCFASPWDVPSLDFLEQLNPPCYKIASATLTYDNLLRRIKETGRPVIASIGMSTYEEICNALEILGTDNLALMICTSTYPNQLNEINLKRIETLRQKFGVPVGYSGHELGITPTLAAVGMGAALVERHITLSREMWGSDQKASLEPSELRAMVEGIRGIEVAMGSGRIEVLDSEIPVMKKLRKAQ